MKTIGITGGTGFVGRHLTDLLLAKGHRVVIFTRHPEKHRKTKGVEYSYWNPAQNKCDHSAIKKLNGVVHLSGTSINKRWTSKVKRDIVNSRVNGTRFLVTQLKREAPHCKTFISASGIGYYGPDKGNKPFTEEDPPADDFLATTCVKWEEEAMAASTFMRTLIFRFGVVLGKDDGAFPQLARPLSFGVMPIFGKGNQVMSWIHIDDLVALIYHGISHAEMSGVYNAVSSHPVSQKEMMEAIASAKGGFKMPVSIPPGALKLMLGEMSTEILKSATVSAQKVLDAGFNFRHADVKEAVKDILSA